MATGLGLKASYLVELMLAGVGQRGAEDLKWHWFETVYSMIREQPWPWNWNKLKTVTFAPTTSVETYTWVAGNNFLQGSAPPTFNYRATGRKILIDNIPYTITMVDIVANRLFLDAPVHTTLAVGAAQILYRADLSIKTSSIFNVQLDGYKVYSTSRRYWRRAGGDRNISLGGSRPTEYELDESSIIPSPNFYPHENGAPGVGNIPPGTYEYFWTAYDSESGNESKPGPTLRITYSGGSKTQSIGYNNPPSYNLKEAETYELRLYRSKISPSGSRSAAWLVGSKIPYDNTSFVQDNLTDLILQNNERYYDGARTSIKWSLWPDALYSVIVEHMNNYSGRPDPDDIIPLGRNNIVTEMLPMGASMFVELANRGVNEQHAAIVKFRQQLAYLVRKTDNANDADPGLEEIVINDGIPDDDGYFYDPTKTYKFKY